MLKEMDDMAEVLGGLQVHHDQGLRMSLGEKHHLQLF